MARMCFEKQVEAQPAKSEVKAELKKVEKPDNE